MEQEVGVQTIVRVQPKDNGDFGLEARSIRIWSED